MVNNMFRSLRKRGVPQARQPKRVTALTLAWRRFKQNKLAIIALVFLVAIYTACGFAEFFAPYLQTQSSVYAFMRPQRIQFIDDQGRFHLRPFVYGVQEDREESMRVMRNIYKEDRTQVFPIHFFVQRPVGEYGPDKLRTRPVLFGVDVDKGEYMFLLGTDQRGRDLLSRMIFGGRTTMSVGLFGMVLSTVLGVLIGIASGYFGGVVDMLIQRFIEMLGSIPTLPLWLSLAAILPKDWDPFLVFWGMTTILALLAWTGLARGVRGIVLSLRERDYVMASLAGGAGPWHIMFRHITPNIASYLIVTGTMRLPGLIMGESALSFLGLGIKAPMTSWGLLLRDAQNLNAIINQPWILLPGGLIILVVSAFNFLGDGLRDAADPFN